MKKFYSLIALACPVFSLAQAFTPNLPENAGLNSLHRYNARVYAGYFDETVFNSLGQPVLITGIRFRLAASTQVGGASSGWPYQILTTPDFTIKIGEAAAVVVANDGFVSYPGLTFNNLFASNAVIARTGALTLNPADYPANPGSSPTNPNPWGPLISFSTPFLHQTGKSLVWGFSSPGHGVSSAFGIFACTVGGPGVATSHIGQTSGFDAVATNLGASSLLVQFETTPVPEPATMSLLALAGLAAARKRKRS